MTSALKKISLTFVIGLASLNFNAALAQQQSWVDLRRGDRVLQGYDFTCGAASVANILWLSGGPAKTEKEVLDVATARLSSAELAKVTEQGFSLLDLKNVLFFFGLQANPFRYAAKKTSDALLSAVPFIAHIRAPFSRTGSDYHFVIFLKESEDRIFLIDPSVGYVTMSSDEFFSAYTGYGLILTKGADRDRLNQAIKDLEKTQPSLKIRDAMQSRFLREARY